MLNKEMLNKEILNKEMLNKEKETRKEEQRKLCAYYTKTLASLALACQGFSIKYNICTNSNYLANANYYKF